MQLVEGGYIATSFRTLQPCRAYRATDIADAVSALAASERPCVVSGATDLPARFNEGDSPTDLIDVSRVPALKRVENTARGLHIGAGVTHHDGARHPLVRAYSTGFAAAWAKIANIRVRFAASIGGNVMARRTRYEGAILLSALGAIARLEGPDGPFERPVEDLWRQDLPDPYLLVSLLLPARDGLRFDYERSLRPIMTQAVAFDAAGFGRVVTATEYTRPVIRALRSDRSPDGLLNLADPVTSAAYLRRVSDTFLERQIARLG